MTTNKPEVKAWIISAYIPYSGFQRHVCMSEDDAHHSRATFEMLKGEVEEVQLISLSDYEALQAEMANRVAELENVLRKASAHIRPTCSELYDELIKTLENKRMMYGCHCDLDEGMEPDGCVIDSGERHNCTFAKDISVKEQCQYWRPITP